MGTPLLYNWRMASSLLRCGVRFLFPSQIYGKRIPIWYDEGFPFLLWFPLSSRLLYSPREGSLLSWSKTQKKRLQFVMRRWGKEVAVTSSPLPLPVLRQPLFSLLQCVMSHQKRPVRALRHPRFSSLAPPLPKVPYISQTTTFSRVYNVLPQSQQAVYRDTAREGGREGESVSGFQRWLRSPRFSHSCSSHFSSLTQASFLLSFSAFLCFFLLLQARADYERDPRGQRCSWVSGSSSPHHQDGLYYGPPGLPNPVPDQLGAGGSVSGGRWCQSAWGALLSGASLAGHWGHGEVLVPLHLSLWNHLFGDRCSRNGCDLQL